MSIQSEVSKLNFKVNKILSDANSQNLHLAPLATTVNIGSSNGNTAVNNNLIVSGSTILNGTTINSNLIVFGNTTLGNSSADRLILTASYIDTATTTVDFNLNANLYFNNSSPSSRILKIENSTGRIGIGTSSPSYPLHVFGSTTINTTYGYLNPSGEVGQATDNTPIGIRADNRIAAAEFNAISDERNKYIYQTPEENLIEKFKNISIVNFKHKEHAKFELDRGVIAQQIEQYFPDAVKKTEDFVCDIFGPPKVKENLNDYEYKLTIGEPNLINVGDKLKIAFKFDFIDEDICEVINVQDNFTFTIKSNKKISDNCSIMGRLVKDYSLVNYQYLFSTTIKIVQSLIERIEILENKLSSSV